MESHRVLWFFIYFIMALAIVWVVGSFITWNLLWFISGWFGRVVALIFFFISMGFAGEQVEFM